MANRTLIAALITLATCSLAAQKEWSFPHTRPNGRATPEYDHNGLHIVVNYDYAQPSGNVPIEGSPPTGT